VFARQVILVTLCWAKAFSCQPATPQPSGTRMRALPLLLTFVQRETKSSVVKGVRDFVLLLRGIAPLYVLRDLSWTPEHLGWATGGFGCH
jgi:hypothetical protein